MDMTGAGALIAFSLLMGLNQVVIKLTATGLGPVFMAGLRSLGAIAVLLLWMRLRGIPLRLGEVAGPGFLAGLFFALEFMCVFIALDLTTVSRASIIFYSMPVWLALGAHLLLPAERLTGPRVLGLVLAMAGVAVALGHRQGGEASLLGDVLALAGALFWAGIALTVRASRLATAEPAVQLFWQVLVSALILLPAAPLFGPLVRDFAPIHLAGLGFQIVAVASLGFLFWFWLLGIYKASSVASFSFLAPVFSVMLGWLILGEQVGPSIWIALALVAAGLVLVNRR